MSTASPPRTGVVLAAGYGSRLEGLSRRTDPKPLTPVAGRPLLFRALRSLERAGCQRAVLVLGYGADAIREAVRQRYDGPLEVAYAYNDRYDRQNGLSVLAARPHVEGTPFLLMMADHVVSDELMDLAGTHPPPDGGATLLVDPDVDAVFDLDDATKVRVEDGRVQAIGKLLDDYNAIDTGVFVCTDGLMDALQRTVDETGDASLSDGVRRLAAENRMQTLPIGDGFWHDVDTPAMLTHAEQVLADAEPATDPQTDDTISGDALPADSEVSARSVSE